MDCATEEATALNSSGFLATWMAATLSQLAALEVTLGGHLGLDQCDCPEARYTSSPRRNTAEFQHDGVTSKLPVLRCAPIAFTGRGCDGIMSMSDVKSEWQCQLRYPNPTDYQCISISDRY